MAFTMIPSRKDDLKGLWAVFWRMLLLTPLVGILGSVLYIAVLGALVIPPFYSLASFLNGDWFYGIAALVSWLVFLRFRKPVLRWTCEGFEHASL